MKKTKVVVGSKVPEIILTGVNIVYDAVKLTLGPKGGNALLYGIYGGSPRITNDGVTIAECIEPKDELVNQVAQSFKEACKKTNEKAGDATTTTTVIAGALANNVLGKVSNTGLIGKQKSSDVMQIRKDLMDAVIPVVEEIKKRAIKVTSLEDLEKIATVSVENEQLGKTIAAIVYQIGIDGFVDVQEGYNGMIEHEVIEGMRFPAKVSAKAFVNNPAKYEMVVQDAPVLVTNYAIDNINEIVAVINTVGFKKMAILAPSFADQVLVEFVKAAKEANIFIFPVKVPALRTEQFEDVCAYFGATFINKDNGVQLKATNATHFGFVDKLVVKDIDAREDAIAIGGKGSKSEVVVNRIKDLRDAISATKVASHRKLIERRIASLASAVAVVKVGAISDAETKYLKLKVEDAVYACKGALEEGYVKGGGLCLKEIAESLTQTILTDALIAPHKQILENAGVDEMNIPDYVIDNAKAVRLAVEHAVSVVAHLVTTKIIVAEMEDESPADGYNKMAAQMGLRNRLWAKREGILLEGNVESEGAYDRMLRGE